MFLIKKPKGKINDNLFGLAENKVHPNEIAVIIVNIVDFLVIKVLPL